MIRGQPVSPPDSDVPVKAGTDRCRSFWFPEAGRAAALVHGLRARRNAWLVPSMAQAFGRAGWV